ncbi:hypothetical protein MRX96_036081 [Rhipicephalus microplus]
MDKDSVVVHLAAKTIARRSVSKAKLVQDQHTVLQVAKGGRYGSPEASFPRLSHAQFFLEEVQRHCPQRNIKRSDAKCFNLPAGHVPNFESAFKCARKESKLKACV